MRKNKIIVLLFILLMAILFSYTALADTIASSECNSLTVGRVQCNFCGDPLNTNCEFGKYYLEKCTYDGWGGYSWELGNAIGLPYHIKGDKDCTISIAGINIVGGLAS
jgi:hypothetical protein